MPLYFGFNATARDGRKVDVSPSLKEMGIHLLRAAPSAVPIVILPFVTSPLWYFFVAALPSILYSLSTGQPVSTNRAGYRIDTKHPNPLPFVLPRVSIEVLNRGQKQQDWLLKNDFEEQEIRGKSYWICEEPTSAVLRELLDSSSGIDFNDRNFVPFGTANISAILVLVEMINLLSYLLQALQIRLYDQLPIRSTIIPPENEIAQLIASMDVDPEDDDDTTTDHVPSSVLGGFISRIFSAFGSFIRGPSKLDMVTATILSTNDNSYPSTSLPDQLSSGNFCRFIPDLCSEDPATIPVLFSQFLARSLGNTTTEIMDRINDYYSAWGILKTTPVGHALAHLSVCVRMSIDAHCGVIPIFEGGVYEGCLLQGAGYTINMRNEKIFPLTPSQLSLEISNIETNGKLLNKLCELFDKRGLKDNYDASKLLIPGKLREYVLKCSLNGTRREEMTDIIRKLRFPTPRWSITLGSVLRFLGLLQLGLEEIPDEYPLGPEAMFSEDLVEIGLSCFKTGSCPSFRHPSGVAIDLSKTKPPGPPRENENNRRSKQPQQVNNGGWIFSVRRVAFDEAVSDFKILVREREARSLGSASSRGLGFFVLSGGNFERVFLEMRKSIAIVDTSIVTEDRLPDVELGTKRAAFDSLDDGEVHTKRRVML